jgi:hypothetical protein
LLSRTEKRKSMTMTPSSLIPISEEVRGVRLELLVEKMRRGTTLLPRQGEARSVRGGGGSAGDVNGW